MRKKVLSFAALLLFLATGASAQQTADGRKVKRITFDREQVNIEYADGTKDLGVSETVIIRESEITGVAAMKADQDQSALRWYTTDGRALQGEPRHGGVYIVKGKNGTKITIKK